MARRILLCLLAAALLCPVLVTSTGCVVRHRGYRHHRPPHHDPHYDPHHDPHRPQRCHTRCVQWATERRCSRRCRLYQNGRCVGHEQRCRPHRYCRRHERVCE